MAAAQVIGRFPADGLQIGLRKGNTEHNAQNGAFLVRLTYGRDGTSRAILEPNTLTAHTERVLPGAPVL